MAPRQKGSKKATSKDNNSSKLDLRSLVVQPKTTGNWTDNHISCDRTSSCSFTNWATVQFQFWTPVVSCNCKISWTSEKQEGHDKRSLHSLYQTGEGDIHKERGHVGDERWALVWRVCLAAKRVDNLMFWLLGRIQTSNQLTRLFWPVVIQRVEVISGVTTMNFIVRNAKRRGLKR